MAIKTYSLKKDGEFKLSEHFKVKEWACKDGSDKIIINPLIVDVLENLYKKLNAKAINITSGYRTPTHSVKVGGYATDQHTKGNAVDIKAKKQDGTYFSSKEITLALEDLKHNGGIGLINKDNSVHIDVRGKKCWFDETNGEKLVNSWYAYWGVKKPEPKPVVNYYPQYKGKSQSLVDALANLKVDSSFAHRKKIAKANSISAYIGTAKQNTKLLDFLKKGKLIKE